MCIGLEDTTPACRHFLDNGNYGLPAPVPGGLAWPGGAPPPPGACACVHASRCVLGRWTWSLCALGMQVSRASCVLRPRSSQV
jgi:hypothetical protein